MGPDWRWWMSNDNSVVVCVGNSGQAVRWWAAGDYCRIHADFRDFFTFIYVYVINISICMSILNCRIKNIFTLGLYFLFVLNWTWLEARFLNVSWVWRLESNKLFPGPGSWGGRLNSTQVFRVKKSSLWCLLPPSH